MAAKRTAKIMLKREVPSFLGMGYTLPYMDKLLLCFRGSRIATKNFTIDIRGLWREPSIGLGFLHSWRPYSGQFAK